MAESSKSGKVPALIFDVPGAPEGWHVVDGLSGLVHSEIPVPHFGAQAFLDAHKQRVGEARKNWDKIERELEEKGLRFHGRLPFVAPDCPVTLVQITEKQAAEGQAAAAKARELAVRGLRELRRIAQPDTEDAHTYHNEAAAITGGEE